MKDTPPVGKNRFKVVHALEYNDKNRVFNATEFGDKCPHLAGVNQINSGMSEDCLVLNIWAPDAVTLYFIFYIFLFIYFDKLL